MNRHPGPSGRKPGSGNPRLGSRKALSRTERRLGSPPEEPLLPAVRVKTLNWRPKKF